MAFDYTEDEYRGYANQHKEPLKYPCPVCGEDTEGITFPDYRYSNSGWHTRRCLTCDYTFNSPDLS